MNILNTKYKLKSVIIDFSSINDLIDTKLFDLVALYGKTIEDFVVRKKKLKKKHIVVVGGGMSAERLVSYMSSDSIVRSVIELGYRVTFVDMGADIGIVLLSLKPDLVYNALHGTYGEDGCLPGILNIMRIPYTGPGVLASAMCFDKRQSYEILRFSGIKVPKSKIIKKSHSYTCDPMIRPYVIKPLRQGSSIGVMIIFPEDTFLFQSYDFPYGEEILVEEYIKGREMQVAVLNGTAIGVLEIKLLKDKRFYDYETKYNSGFADYLLPAPVPVDVYSSIKKIAEKACNILKCTVGIIRVEMIFFPEEGSIYMLELNTHPGMTPLSICPKIAALEKICYNDLIKRIIEGAKFEHFS